MKSQKTTFKQLTDLYTHPSAALFRAIELRTIYENSLEFNFVAPSLDLGCGDGKIAELVFDEPFTYGVDNGEAKDVEEAVKNGRYEKVFLESAENMSLQDSSLNFVFSNCVIEHIPNNAAVLSEVGRILKDGGYFMFTVPSHNFPNYLYLTNKFASYGLSFFSRLYKYRRNKMLNQFHCYDVDDWASRLKPYNLKVVKHKYYISKPALMMWDKLALNIFFRKFFISTAEKDSLRENFSQLETVASRDNVVDSNGAGLFILCKKIAHK